MGEDFSLWIIGMENSDTHLLNRVGAGIMIPLPMVPDIKLPNYPIVLILFCLLTLLFISFSRLWPPTLWPFNNHSSSLTH